MHTFLSWHSIAGTTVQKDVLQELGTHSIDSTVWQHTTFVPGSLYIQQPGKLRSFKHEPFFGGGGDKGGGGGGGGAYLTYSCN